MEHLGPVPMCAVKLGEGHKNGVHPVPTTPERVSEVPSLVDVLGLVNGFPSLRV